MKRKLLSIVNKLQAKFAKFMNQKTKNMSMKKVKVLLIVFTLVLGGYCVYLIVTAFERNNNGKFHVDKITVPKHAMEDDEQATVTVSENDYNKILLFKKHMDSLHKFNRKSFDSIMVFRPGLMDSIKFLEREYLSNKK